MTATYPLTITRNRGYFGKLRALQLYAKTPSGRVKLGRVAQGKSVTVEVPHAAREIYGKMDWIASEPLDLTFINPGDTVYANLRFTLNPLRMFGLMKMPCRFESQPR